MTMSVGILENYFSRMYLIYDEAIVQEATYNMQLGVLIGGNVRNKIKFADIMKRKFTAMEQ